MLLLFCLSEKGEEEEEEEERRKDKDDKDVDSWKEGTNVEITKNRHQSSMPFPDLLLDCVVVGEAKQSGWKKRREEISRRQVSC